MTVQEWGGETGELRVYIVRDSGMCYVWGISAEGHML